MKAKLAGCLMILFRANISVAADPNAMDKYFSMSPAELAAIPVSIATGTPKPIYQSAAATSVVTAQQIKAMGATELHEILETVPGVHAELQEVTYDYHYTIRGINNPTNSEILFMMNGTRVSTPLRGTFALGLELPVDAIERIEVIRGPGSALYGADAFAGVINIITKKAKELNGATAGVRAGNWNTQSTWGQYGSEWAGWDVAASLQYQHTDGDNGRFVQGDSQTTFDQRFGTHASLAPGPMQTRYQALNGHLNLRREHWDIGFWAIGALDIGTRGGAAAALDPTGAENGAQYLADMRFSTADWYKDWEFKAHTSYLQSQIHENLYAFPANTVLPIGADGNINPSSTHSVLFPNGAIENLGQIQRIPSIELSSLYKGWANHLVNSTAGYRYEEVTSTDLTNFGAGIINGAHLPAAIGGALTDVTNTSSASLMNKHRSILSYALQDEWQMAPDWQLTAGVRYDHYSDFGSTVNPRAALIWNVNHKLTNKLMYGKAFRAPNFTEEGTQNNPVLQGNPNLSPETIHTVELAMDYRPFSSFRTVANLFYYHIDNLISAVPNNASVTSYTYRNFGNQDSIGSELEWNWQLNSQWNLKGNYSWQNAQSSITHQRVTGVPEHQVYFAAAWQFFRNWQLQSQLKWIGNRTSPPGDTRPLNDYQTIDLTLKGNKLFGHVNLAASLRNLFNTTGRDPSVTQFQQNLPLPGRSFYLEASVKF